MLYDVIPQWNDANFVSFAMKNDTWRFTNLDIFDLDIYKLLNAGSGFV